MRLTASIALDATFETRAESIGIDETPRAVPDARGLRRGRRRPDSTPRAVSTEAPLSTRETARELSNARGRDGRHPRTRALLFARANDGASTWITRASPAEIVAADHDRDADDDARVLARDYFSLSLPRAATRSCAVAFVNETHVGAWRQRVPPEAVDTREKRETFREALNAASDAGGGSA